MCFSCLDCDYGFGEENHREGPSSSTWHVIGAHGIYVIFTDEVNLDHSVTVGFASFSTVRLLFFLVYTLFLCKSLSPAHAQGVI